MFRQNARLGTHRDYHPRYAQRLERRRRIPALRTPEDEDPDEMLALSTCNFFHEAQLLYGVISEFCTEEQCPTTCAGRRYEYRWTPGQPLAAPQYFRRLEEWVQSQLDDENLFPTRLGVPFPRGFRERVQLIFKRLFRVYAHIYYHHFERIAQLGAEPHLNSCFQEFMRFVLQHDLIPDRAQMQPLAPLISSTLCADEWRQCWQRHAQRRWSRLRRLAPRVGGFSALLLELYTEVHYRPGNPGAKSAREHFATIAAAADLMSGKGTQAQHTLCQECAVSSD